MDGSSPEKKFQPRKKISNLISKLLTLRCT
jgi:hypothetical protein